MKLFVRCKEKEKGKTDARKRDEKVCETRKIKKKRKETRKRADNVYETGKGK